jgi:hypothetical protein
MLKKVTDRVELRGRKPRIKWLGPQSSVAITKMQKAAGGNEIET